MDVGVVSAARVVDNSSQTLRVQFVFKFPKGVALKILACILLATE
jgi:hypothetical protein